MKDKLKSINVVIVIVSVLLLVSIMAGMFL